MERRIPVDAESARAEFAAISAHERDTWLDYAAIKRPALTPRKIATIGAVIMFVTALLTGISWARHNLDLGTGTALSIVFMVLLFKVIAPWIDRRQSGVERPLVPPPELRSEVWRFHTILFAPLLIGMTLWLPALFIAEDAGAFALVAVVNLVAMSALMLAQVWWTRRLARCIESGWRPSDIPVSDVVAALIVLVGFAALVGLGGSLVAFIMTES